PLLGPAIDGLVPPRTGHGLPGTPDGDGLRRPAHRSLLREGGTRCRRSESRAGLVGLPADVDAGIFGDCRLPDDRSLRLSTGSTDDRRRTAEPPPEMSGRA